MRSRYGGSLLVSDREYKIKVYPKGRGRDIYRVIQVEGDMDLDYLCYRILTAFDLDQDHLYESCMTDRPYSPGNILSYSEDDEPVAEDILIDQLHLEKGQKSSLLFDYGDDWLFVINVQAIYEALSDLPTPCAIQEKGELVPYPNWDDEEE